jgi:G6PDH family F420-dependent oxidoreductase
VAGHRIVMRIGYHLSSEEHPPERMLPWAQRAERVGFSFITVSDHYHPWTREQGESPFVWSVLGGLAQATERIQIGTAVTCPTVRIHPAVIAQAAATTERMMPGRFFLGVGTGEALNEHILGDVWPDHARRLEMLEEAVEVMRALWQGDTVTHRGEHYTVEQARIFTLPERPPPVIVSGFGRHAIDAAARIGDGYMNTKPDADALTRYRDGGGLGPAYGKLDVSVAASREQAVREAHRTWPTSGLGGELGQVLPLPVHFEAAAANVRPEQVAESIVCEQDAGAHLEHLRAYQQAGYTHVTVQQVGGDQERFFDLYQREVLPELGAVPA